VVVIDNWDYCFAENGLTAWKLGKELESASFIKFVGEEEYKKMVNFILRYLSEVDVPVKRYVTYLYSCGSSLDIYTRWG
jgi:phosphomannomutase